MKIARRDIFRLALGLPAAPWLASFNALAAPAAGMVKITSIRVIGLDNLGDGCLIRINTDAGLVGYGEAGLPAAVARARIEMMQPQLIGQDPLAIARHFYESESEEAGKTTAIKIGVLQVWQKQDGKWKLYARQAHILPKT